MEGTSFKDEDYGLWFLLHLTRDAIFRARKKDLRPLAISPVQSAVLFSIHAIGNEATPAEISRWVFREPHSVSGIIDRMENQGLVRRSKDLNRKNLVRVTLTERGQELLRRSAKREVIHHIMSSITEEERQQLRSLLEKLLVEALKELRMERKLPFP